MASIIKVDTIQDQAGNNIISESANVITIGASGDTITIPSGASMSGFNSTGIDDNATSTAITIDSSENVGIGTSSPGTKLDILATGYNASAISTTVSDYAIKLAGATTSSYFSNGLIFSEGTLARSAIGSFDGGSSGRQGLWFATHNGTSMAERVRIDDAGNVGIGTSSPDCKVHMLENTNNSGSTGLANGGLQIENTNTTANSWSQIHLKSSSYDAHIRYLNGGLLKFMVDGNTDAMNIDNNGNVGIGTTSPSPDFGSDTILEISGGSNPGLVINDTGQASKYGIHAFSTDFGITYGSGIFFRYTPGDNSMIFGNSERMRITNDGKLLVNTTSNGTESNLNVQGQFGMSSARGFIFEKQEGRNGSFSSITLQFTTGANGRTCFIESMVGSSGYHLYHVSQRYRGDTPNVLVNQGNGPTVSWSVSNSGSNTGSVYTYVVNFPSSTSHPYAKFKVSLGGYITTPITSPSITFA
jgi:hypothetical protein